MKPTLTLSLIAALALAACSRTDVTPVAHAAVEIPPRDAGALPQYPPLQPDPQERPLFDYDQF